MLENVLEKSSFSFSSKNYTRKGCFILKKTCLALFWLQFPFSIFCHLWKLD